MASASAQARAAASAFGFPAVWLRHNCPCPDCRDPVTGQRLVEITQLSNEPLATVTAERDDFIEVTFTPSATPNHPHHQITARSAPSFADLSLFPAAPFTYLSVVTIEIGQIGRNSGQNR